ncbi:MAG: 4-(cytidine 5'-diphospho)-2-C-methyl-D-erythritol kinase [Nanoarchaeota archaeon]|nr:4-(cytidine 5'-diphospho)-2-C-methyl-D-erythritol kinase [Nanoarchaeota archaeon]MBU1704120.1 4-(cytidine 5'-diphospho)-2-C-methyl-D-erythritol kinase [Nanoarchaeota archaeon]
MTELEIKAYAKVNLTLDIVKKREDNYHDINSVLHQVTLHDTILIRPSDKIIVQCKGVPEEGNLAYKAAYLLKRSFNIQAGAIIDIDKKIPIGGGLSGGSSDAASVLKALNELWELDLNVRDLMKLGSELGMDVPFSVIGGTGIASNRGDIIEKIDSPALNFVLVNPGMNISSKEAYQSLDLSKCGKAMSTEKMIKAIQTGNVTDIAKNLHNDFETAISERYAFVIDIKKDLKANGALNSVMSGSGATVYGIFETKEKAKQAYAELKHKYDFVCVAESVR